MGSDEPLVGPMATGLHPRYHTLKSPKVLMARPPAKIAGHEPAPHLVSADGIGGDMLEDGLAAQLAAGIRANHQGVGLDLPHAEVAQVSLHVRQRAALVAALGLRGVFLRAACDPSGDSNSASNDT